MKRIITTLITCLAILLFVSACTKTEYDLFGNIRGIVIDEDTGEPIQQVSVYLSQITSMENPLTGADGQFEFRNLEEGTYTINLRKSGYGFDHKDVRVNPGETTTVSLTMKKKEAIK